jgi:CBS domain-containing protein
MQTVGQLLQIKGTEVFSVSPHDSVLRAIEVMATRHVGALLVMNQGSLVGIISERDYARKVILKNRSSHDTPVGDIMTPSPVSVTPEDTVHHCMQLMTDGRFRHLPVVKGGRVAACCPSVIWSRPSFKSKPSTSSSSSATSRDSIRRRPD